MSPVFLQQLARDHVPLRRIYIEPFIHILIWPHSFLIRRKSTLYSRRSSKIVTLILSLFTSSYVFNWSKVLPHIQLQYPPSFDGRVVVYPGEKEIRDYFSWRQADSELVSFRVHLSGSRMFLTKVVNSGSSIMLCGIFGLAHINNLYNTTHWALVQQGGQTSPEASITLKVRCLCLWVLRSMLYLYRILSDSPSFEYKARSKKSNRKPWLDAHIHLSIREPFQRIRTKSYSNDSGSTIMIYQHNSGKVVF